MREPTENEGLIVSGGEVGATGMVDDVSYTGIYPACEFAGQVAGAFTMGLAELTSRVGGVIADGLALPEKISERIVHECIRTHGDSFPSLPPSAGAGPENIAMAAGGDLLPVRTYGE